MLMAATHGRHTLFIDHDLDPLNPRTDWEPFGKLICFHKRYNLGDEHKYSDPCDLLDELLVEHNEMVARPLYSKLRSGAITEATLTYCRKDREWVLRSFSDITKKWYDQTSYPSGLRQSKLPTSFVSDVCEFLSTRVKLDLLASIPGMIIQPLYLYDHSIRSISTCSYIGRAVHAEWDSSQVGWTYATPKMILTEYGAVTAEMIEKAQISLNSGVLAYDSYLRGECYGFLLYEDQDEIESCWGFLGSLDQMKEDVRQHLPSECVNLVDQLAYCGDHSIADYFWQLSHKAS